MYRINVEHITYEGKALYITIYIIFKGLWKGCCALECENRTTNTTENVKLNTD